MLGLPAGKTCMDTNTMMFGHASAAYNDGPMRFSHIFEYAIRIRCTGYKSTFYF